MPRLHHLLLIAVAAAVSIPAHALEATPVYRVTAIVFAIHRASLDGREQWALEPNPPQRHLSRAILPLPGLAANSGLGGTLQLLRRDPHYTVLDTVHWLQPGVGPTQAVPMAIQNPAQGLSGTIRVYQYQYLHADLNLSLGAHRSSPTGSGAPLVYRLIEARRLKPKAIEYFDHPKLGVLLRVTPMQQP